MSMGTTMKWMGRSARNRAEAVGHQMKDRVLEKRLERSSDEAGRLRFENDLLRDEIAETRSEHHRILDMLESRMSESREREIDGERTSHKGRWLLFLLALGGGAFAWMRMRSNGGMDTDEWGGHLNDSTTVAESTAATI